ncbi:MAG: 50S ribosomal protein L7/L12 [candidate division WWE3 bacterium GW2011_GWC1_41_7]|uniref:50S ribosomal protein L7/L12 n=1 Tax=candidate division WWE3 bacterium GW2011_GWC1_41_7 TaxID=1619119 RepID=A0A0G0X8M6_UNCKA|nr:MAG: 50S ribosomal protein L7/L12 [candidate division WWE3 bacterium GW2011_GWC1_41_7]
MSSNQDISKLKKLLDDIDNEVRIARRLLIQIDEANRKDYRQVPGVEGVFDGFFLTTEDGQKFEVPANYSAKSRLVFGDTLKILEEDGKQLFKQIMKVNRRRVDGVVNKKDGKWYVLADTGSYRLNDKAVEFNNLLLNDKVAVLIPEDNLNAPYAALDKAPDMVKRVEIPYKKEAIVEEKIELKRETVKVIEKPVSKPTTPKPAAPKPAAHKATPKKPTSKPVNKFRPETKSESPTPSKPKEESVDSLTEGVTQILTDEDLR